MRNKRPIVYKNFVSTVFKEDERGRKIGKGVVYTEPITVYGTVSTPVGRAVLAMFGTDENYDKTIVLDKPDIDINENSVFWLDVQYGENVPYDHVVTKVLRNHNFLTIGVRKVVVGNGDSN